MNTRDRIPEPLREQAMDRVAQLSRAQVLAPYTTSLLTKAGRVIEVSMVSTALLNESGQVYGIATTERGVNVASPSSVNTIGDV